MERENSVSPTCRMLEEIRKKQSSLPPFQPTIQRDRLISFTSEHKERKKSSLLLNILRDSAVVISMLALFFLLLLAAQPLLAIFLSFGLCLLVGYQEWQEFTQTILSFCIWPAIIFSIGTATSFYINIKMQRITQQIFSDFLLFDFLKRVIRAKRVADN